ncbi:MAG: archaellin/type IV pilin N-terminal domain-containing protein, partial [Desulfurococcus sp.]|uniref:archaellin/type IV pilin N-terminal domain-containing protein n=1 Tax=Desulfurococcus sp. TaxID=51678 RepID=UPI003D10889A
MKKAISPVIATVIIVAVTIAIAIAVALWMTGLVGSFTGTENLQIVSAYATKNPDGNWTIYLQVKNVGTVDVTIDNIFINGVPVSSLTNKVQSIIAKTQDKTTTYDASNMSNISIPIGTGQTANMNITVQGYTAGQMLEIKLHSAAGKEYPKQITL